MPKTCFQALYFPLGIVSWRNRCFQVFCSCLQFPVKSYWQHSQQIKLQRVFQSRVIRSIFQILTVVLVLIFFFNYPFQISDSFHTSTKTPFSFYIWLTVRRIPGWGGCGNICQTVVTQLNLTEVILHEITNFSTYLSTVGWDRAEHLYCDNERGGLGFNCFDLI